VSQTNSQSQQPSLSHEFHYWPVETCEHEVSPYDSSCRPEPKYSGWGVFALLWGMSAKPRSVVFKCWKCDRTVFESDDAELLEQHGKT